MCSGTRPPFVYSAQGLRSRKMPRTASSQPRYDHNLHARGPGRLGGGCTAVAGGSIMNTLIPWTARIEDYLRYRRRFGFALVNEESTLRNFAAFADHAELPDRLTAALAGQWARTSKRQSPITWARRIEVLRGFARYWQQFDGATEIPERTMFGAAHRRRVPHIYSEEEILGSRRTSDSCA